MSYPRRIGTEDFAIIRTDTTNRWLKGMLAHPESQESSSLHQVRVRQTLYVLSAARVSRSFFKSSS